MYKIATVFFNPSDQDINFFRDLSDIFDVIIYLNSPVEGDSFSKANFIGDGENVGLGAALNCIFDSSILEPDDPCLYLDQDSRMSRDEIFLLFTTHERRSLRDVVVPVIDYGWISRGIMHDRYWGFFWAISSGMVVTKRVFLEVGGLKSDYFIDRLDFEFCYRLKAFGVRIFLENRATLRQQLGESSIGPVYSRSRIYWQARNLRLFSLRDSARPVKGLVYLVLGSLKHVSVFFFRRDFCGGIAFLRGVFGFELR